MLYLSYQVEIKYSHHEKRIFSEKPGIYWVSSKNIRQAVAELCQAKLFKPKKTDIMDKRYFMGYPEITLYQFW